MQQRLDSYLYKKFPHLFADRYADMRQTAMCWGFECGGGWYQIIKQAAEKLEPLIVDYRQKNPLAYEAGYCRASQVKEKYGTLRFYLTSGTDAMYAITDAAERKSWKICEVCGKPGRLYTAGWCVTRCKRHYHNV